MSIMKTRKIADIALFAGLSVAITILGIEIPYPILPYLKFDIAEIPIVILFFLEGFLASFVAETLHWIMLSISRGWVLGPFMKFISIVSMLTGFWISAKFYKKISSNFKLEKIFLICLTGGITVRVIVTSIANIIVLLIIAPQFLHFAGILLSNLGFSTSSSNAILILTLIFTALFNILHVFVSSIIMFFLIKHPIVKEKVITQLQENT